MLTEEGRKAAEKGTPERQLLTILDLRESFVLADPATFATRSRWPLEPRYVETFPPEKPVPMESLFDKISFRDGFDPAGPYLLLDGLSNGGHKHLDGNSLPRLTQFGRIWLADNDYFKTAVKYQPTR